MWPLSSARPSPGPRPPATRCVVLEEGRSASGDYLLTPRLERLGLPLVRIDSRTAPRADAVRPGDLVVLARYLPAAWRRRLQAQLGRLAGLVYFMDDDLLDPAAHAGLASAYARKLGTLAAAQARWLRLNATAFWVATPVLAAKYADLLPELLPLAPPTALVEPAPLLRIAYHGSASHAAEIEWLHPIVAAVQARCPNTLFELFGEHPVHKRYRDLPRVAVLHPMRWENYLAWTASQPAAIGLAPLLPGAFNAARGAVKFVDYARQGAVGLYTDVAPYRGFVADGVDGLLLPNDPDRWVETIVELACGDGRRLTELRAAARARATALATGGAPTAGGGAGASSAG